jgi:peroxiredoxin
MLPLIYLLLFTAQPTGHHTAQLDGYHITGTVQGLPDGTWLYLRTATPDKEIDSCKITNGGFSLSGRIDEPAEQVYLHTYHYTQYTSFWLENKNIRISLHTGEFKQAKITGSATQNEARHLDSLETGLDRDRQQAIERNYVRSHPNSLVAANLLNVYTTTWGRDTTKILYDHLSDKIKASRYGKEINEYIQLNRPVSIGSHYADFGQTDTAGKTVRLSDIKAKYLLLDFWASWCAPCREENKELVSVYEKFKDKGFVIVGVSMDDNKAFWLKAIADDKLTWMNLSDLRGGKNQASLIYGISAIPTNFLIDDKGVIVAAGLHGQALEDKLKDLLTGKKL